MLTYDELKTHPRKFLSLTSLTPEEFEDLLPAFARAYLKKYPASKTMTGKTRKRKAGAGRQGSLASIEQKLLFALVYQKSYPLQSILGDLFGMSQSQANEWIHRLLLILKQALDGLGFLPERDPQKFKSKEENRRDAANSIIDGMERRRQRPKKAEKQALHYIPNMLSRSRFNRKLYRIADLFLTLFLRLGETWKKMNERSDYVIDSYPIAVCDNYRIKRSKIYHGEDFQSYLARKKRYFYGLRIHFLVAERDEPVEFFLEPGAFSDTSALALYNFDLPTGPFITGDKAYTNCTIEDVTREAGLELIPLRKKNSLRAVPAYMTYFQASIRKIIETTGSLIERLLPKSIHAVTPKGFELKVALFVLACSINFLW